MLQMIHNIDHTKMNFCPVIRHYYDYNRWHWSDSL